MTMANEKGNLALVRKDLRDSFHVGDIVDYSPFNPLAAEIIPGVTPSWHIIEAHPNHERTAAGHLVARRFGMFVPETEDMIVRRGRKLIATRLMFTGYLFVFVWDILKHQGRIESCPGVSRIFLVDGQPAVISDKIIDEIRAVENSRRPLPAMMVDGMAASTKKKKRHWRKSERDKRELEEERANEIVCCRPWSPFQDSLLSLDSQGRNQTLLNALGLPSTPS